jgi:hypothetical protein
MLCPARQDKANLRADTGNARLEGAKRCPGPAVAGQLLEVVADQPEGDLFGEEL